MEEDTIESPVTGRDPEWKNKQQNNHCVINIFCDEKNRGGGHGGQDDSNCVINIFCGEETCDWGHDNKDSGNCVINIFCGEKKHDEPCADKKPSCKW